MFGKTQMKQNLDFKFKQNNLFNCQKISIYLLCRVENDKERFITRNSIFHAEASQSSKHLFSQNSETMIIIRKVTSSFWPVQWELTWWIAQYQHPGIFVAMILWVSHIINIHVYCYILFYNYKCIPKQAYQYLTSVSFD